MRLIKSFGYALNGIAAFFSKEKNGQIQAAVGLAAVTAGFYYNISSVDWCILIICIAIVLAFEMMNSALEKICNLVNHEIHPAVKIIKDVSAAAVLVAAFGAVASGIIIFIKYL